MIKNVDLSVVTCVRDKKQFKESARAVLNQVVDFSYEYVVVDWGSKRQDVLSELKRLLSDIRNRWLVSVRYLRVDSSEFNRGRALNVGIKWALGKWILTFDCDLLVGDSYLSKLFSQVSYGTGRLCLWCLGVEQVSKKERPFCGSGIMLVFTEAVYRVTGYDERFKGYGEEDIDFKHRLERLGLVTKKVSSPKWIHMTHSDKERGQAQFCSRIFCSRINKVVNPNRARRLRNDELGIVEVNGNGWGEIGEGVKHVELK